MDRRGFLKGVFGGVTAAGVIVAASPADIAAFASPLVREAPVVLDVPTKAPAESGEHLYNAAGELVAIIDSFNIRRQTIDVTMAGDLNRVYLPGRLDIDIHARWVGHVDTYPTFGRAVSR